MKLASRVIIAMLLLLLLPGTPARSQDNIIGTYSIVAWDSSTGDLGVAVQSKFLGVGAVVPYARAGVGAVATQALANTLYGPQALELLSYALTARQVVDTLVHADPESNSRQVGIVDAHGNAAAFTGSTCQPYAGHLTGRGYTVQGNILAGEEVIKAMARTFEITPGDLADRLLAALDAGEKAGGDRRGRQSAALLVVRDKAGYGGFNDRFVDIRVDDNPAPLVELRRLYTLWSQTFLLDARMRSIEQFRQQKKFSAADQEMQRIVGSMNAILRDKPDDPDVLNSVAWTLATYDIDRVRALDLAKRAAKLAPGRLQILDTMAECHYHLGHFDEAIAIESELVTKEPTNDTYWKQLQKFKDGKQRSGH